jgi:hypothetical protein
MTTTVPTPTPPKQVQNKPIGLKQQGGTKRAAFCPAPAVDSAVATTVAAATPNGKLPNPLPKKKKTAMAATTTTNSNSPLHFLSYNTAKHHSLRGLAVLLASLPAPLPALIFLQEVILPSPVLTAFTSRHNYTIHASTAPLPSTRTIVTLSHLSTPPTAFDVVPGYA